MSQVPLITIITPCFNAGETLPMALASLVAQSVESWECLVVDDGSEDSVAHIVERFDDERITHFAFEENRGRSVARQVALERARGDFVCMLDADDWYYADKLERQLTVMREHPELVAVSTGMAVIDTNDELVGMRPFAEEELKIHIGEMASFPKMPFPPVMIRRRIAQQESFDPGLKRSEDFDYLMRVLEGKSYGVMRDIGYAYREVFSDESMKQALASFRYQRQIFGRQIGNSPVAAGRQFLWSAVKSGVYGAAQGVGGGEWLFERRNRRATKSELVNFEAHRRVVVSHCDL